MKTRPTRIARAATRRRRIFAFHPLSFAICLGFASGAALALPQGGTVVAGQATITKPSSTSQVINQSTNKAIIDWQSFSIAAGEKVRFNQPSTTAVTLNRVTGYDPSYLLGEMSSNGKIFLVNPYGVVFGAGARIDVGGLVASSLSIANNDFLASRYSLTWVDPAAPAQRGEVRNEGTISAPGGTVVLAGPSVTNTGTIVANGGRVGMVAANAVSVDVEGDGLLFFQTSATEAKNRLEQLGRIQADGGTVEMRAAARGAFADTVLNMTGIVQAKTMGTRGGRIVIDGGGEGIVAVSGRLDATGLAAGERGGSVTIQGQRVLLDNGSVVDASGSAGGGAIRVGGDFHGANPEIRNAEVTGVASGAVVRADAVDAGDGGTVAIWSDGTTRFYGNVSAQGGRHGGDGGFVEVSGKQNLDFRGDVSTLAPKGKNGTLLLDPTDIVITAAPSSLDDGQLDAGVPIPGDPAGLIRFDEGPVGTATISTAKLEAIAVNNSINLTAVNAITIDPLASLFVTTPNTLTLNTNGGSVQFHSGAGGFSMTPGNTINVTNGSLLIDSAAGPINVGTLQATAGVTLTGGAVTLNAPISVTAAGAGVIINGATTLVGTGGTITLTGSNAANDVTLGTVNGAGRTLAITANGGDIVLGAVGGSAALLNVTLGGNTASLGAVTTTAAQNYSGVTTTTLGGTLTVNTAGFGVSAGATVLSAAGGTITLTGSNAANDVTLGTVNGARPLVITAGGGDVVLGAVGGTTALTGVAVSGNTAGLGNVTTSGPNGVGANGAPGGDVTIATSGSLSVGNIAARGGNGPAGFSAAGGGDVDLSTTNGAISTGLIDTTGGAGSTIAGGAVGGKGGDVTLTVAGAGSNLLSAGAITALGGKGSDNTTATGTGSTGGAGGTVSITNSSTGNTTTLGIDTTGGAAGAAGAAVSTGGDGGAAGTITVTANAGTLAVGNLTATGGAATTGNGGPAGTAGANQAIALNFGQASAGTLDLTNAAFAPGASVTATGGAGTDTVVVVAGANENIVLAPVLLTRSVAGNVVLASVEAASITAGSGTGTTSLPSWTGTATVQLTGGTGLITGNNAGTTLVAVPGGSTFNVATPDTGTAGATPFTQVGNLRGGAGVDSFVIANLGTLTGGITGVGGNDSLDLSARVTADFGLTSASSGTASGVTGGYTNIATLIGNNGTSTLTGTATGSLYTVSAGNAGTVNDGVGTTTFSGVGNLVGGIGADTFSIAAAGSLTGSIDGGITGVNTLDLSARATANFGLTTASSGTVSGVTGGYTNVTTLIGNNGTSTLTGTAAPSTYTVDAANAGNVNGSTNFSGIGSLVGGIGADTFAITTGSLTGSIDGGITGVNTLDLSARATANFGLTTASSGTASGVTGGYTNVTTLVGNNGTSTLTGTAAPSTYTVTAANTGNVNGTTNFSGVGNLVGGIGADTFAITTGSLTGSIDGGITGVNTLDLSTRATANFGLTTASSGTASGVTGGYTNVTTLIGNNGTSTLTGTAAASTYTVDAANAGNVNGSTNFSGIGSLVGGIGADTFAITTGSLTGSVDGGITGVNTLDLSTRATANFGLTTASSGTASGVTGGYTNVTTLIGNNGTSTLTGTAAPSTYTVTAANAGNVNGTTNFSGVPNLVGGTGADSFVIGAGFSLASIDGGTGAANSLTATAGAAENLTLTDVLLTRSIAGSVTLANLASATLIGGAGNNTVNGSGWSGTLTLPLTAGTDVLTGNGVNTTLVAPAAGATITVTSPDAGNSGTTTFTQVGNLRGGAGVDVFAIANAGTLTGGITGVGGNDTLDLSLKAGPVTIDQSGITTGSGVAGTISGVTNIIGSGASTTFLGSNASQTYTVTGANTFTVGGQTLNNVGSIVAGTGADNFVVLNPGTLAGSIDGGAGANTLDLSNKVGAVGFGLASPTSGSATGITGGYTNIGSLIGNGGTSTLTGLTTGSLFAVTGANAGTVDGTNFSAIANLVGGTGADTFQITNAGTLSGSINGGGGAGTNTLDLATRGTANFALASAASGTVSGVTGGYTNVSTLIGNGATSTLTGSATGSTYAVTGADAGTVNDGVGTTTFSGIVSLTGGIGADTFQIVNAGSLSGTINGGGGAANTLNLSTRGTANFGLASASSGTVSGVTGGYTNVTTLVGNGASSTLTGTNVASLYSVTGADAGTVNDGIGTTTFSGIASLVGGTAADSFALGNGGSLNGSIAGGGGAGVNTLDLSARATANFGLASASSGTVSGVTGGYSGVTTLIGNGGTSALTGTNTASTFTVTASNAGTVNDGVGTTSFSGVPNLVGGTAADSFVIGAGFALASIDGGTGAANSLTDTAGATENLTLSNAQLARSVAGNVTLANIASATLTGGAGNNIINAAGWTGGRTVTVRATTGNDAVTGNGVGTTLVGTAAPSTFNVSGPDSGTLTDGVNVTTLSGVGNLTGGASNDTFVIQDAGTLTGNLDGGGGLNTLDLSNKSSATIVFNTSNSTVTGVGIAGSLTNIGNLIGNSTNTTLQGDAAGQSFAITNNNEITVGGVQVFQGVGNLQAGIGADSISGTTFRLTGSILDAGGPTTLSGTIRTDGSQTYLGPIAAPALTLIGLGGITATNPGNDFGTVSLTGGAIDLRDANAINLTSVVVGAGQTLAITSGSTITLNGNVTTTADQTYSGNVLLATSATLSAGAGDITVQGNVDGGTNNLTLASTDAAASAIAISGNVANVGVFTASGNATLNGNVTSTGTQTFNGTLALTANSTLDAGAGKVDLRGAVDGGGNSLVATSSNGAADAIRVGGNISNTAQFTANGLSTLAANVVTTGNQTYTGAVTLVADAVLDAGAAAIALQGGLNGGTHNLTLASTGAAANAIALGGPATNLGVFNANGNATLAGNVTSTGTQTYTATVALTGNATLDAGAGKLDLRGAVDAGGHNLGLTSSNAAADAVHAGAAIANAAQLTVTGKSALATGITTTGAQIYSDTVTLGGNSDFAGSSLSYGNGIVAGSFDLGLRADALNLAGTVSGTGNATLSSLTQSASLGVAGAVGTLQISQATLDRISSFASLTVGRADGSGDLTFGNVVLPTSITLLSGSGDITFTGTVASPAGQARNLAINTGGVTTFSGAVGGAIGGTAALGNLSVAGATQVDASVTANGNVSLAGPVTVGADATLSAAAISLGNSLDVGTRAVTFLSDALTVAGPATGTGAGSVRIATKDATGSMGVAGAAGTLQVSQGLVNTFAGVPTLALGRSDGTGTITVGTLTLPTDVSISSGSGNVAFTGTLDSAAGPARDLSVATTGTTSFSGAVGATRALDALTVSGTSQLGASIVTSGAQTYTGASTLLADSTLTGPSVSFGSTVDGARALTVNAAATNFAAAVGATTALTSLTTNAAGTTQLGGNVSTSGNQTYNDALQLNADVVLAGSTLNLAGTVNGAHMLAVNGSAGVTLGSAIGAGTALTGLSVSGPLQLNAGSVTTSGVQSYAGVTTLGAAATLTASSIAFGNTLDGGFALTTQSAGPTSLAGAVGATTALASLTASGGGAVQLAGPSIDTTGAQSYSGALQLTGNSRLTGSALTLTGAVSGATDLTLQTNALSGGTSIAGSGVLTITPVDPTLAIGVAGGAGALQVSQATLDGASGFTSHVIGRADGSGTISAGNLQLRANTTLQTATGDLNLAGSVDGAFALTLNSGGTTRITGPVGAGTALTSLTTDNNAAAADWNGTGGERTTFDTADGTGAARVITGGAQNYNDPVTATVPVSFTGGAITATQATNRFDGVVSANAISLDLRNTTDLSLGSVTLVNGGSLVTDGVLHITGALQLNGGVLTLTSNATPTSIDLSDPEYTGKTLSFGFVPIKEASATIVQDAGGSIASAAGSLLVLRAPAGGSISLEQPGNTLLGQVSAVTGTLGDNDVSRFNNATGELTLGFIRIASSEIHVAGSPPANGDQTLLQAGLEGDVIKLTADVLTTGPDGLIRARLPFNNIQGAQTSLPGLTLAMTPTALLNGGGFGGPDAADFIQVQVGASEGGFLTARPKGTSGDTAVIFLGGDASVTPFYDGAGKITEIRIFYNGNAPRTPQEAGALAAVIALIEDARQARFEEAVRTENVRSRLRSGVIAEVGAGRPATVGRESIRLPDTCEIKPKTLQCE